MCTRLSSRYNLFLTLGARAQKSHMLLKTEHVQKKLQQSLEKRLSRQVPTTQKCCKKQDDIKIFNEAEEQLMKRELNFYESKKDADRPDLSLD